MYVFLCVVCGARVCLLPAVGSWILGGGPFRLVSAAPSVTIFLLVVLPRHRHRGMIKSRGVAACRVDRVFVAVFGVWWSIVGALFLCHANSVALDPLTRPKCVSSTGTAVFIPFSFVFVNFRSGNPCFFVFFWRVQVAELKKKLVEMNLPTDGLKAALQARLLQAFGYES